MVTQGRGLISNIFKYRAFVSYAHADERVAARLHRALEAYRVPQYLQAKHSKKLSPIFRDVTELTAHHSLSDKIKEAVLKSRCLIVLCSPAAKTSKWVNEEIRLFRELHGEDSILCALIEGTPQTSFPPALSEGGREPLAADLKPKSFRLGVSQLAASMLGVGLDELVQRDLKKMRRRVIGVTVSAASALLVMGTLTWTAVDARQEAEQRRTDAEGQIEFMITDLKDELESVGRLDALKAVGERASTYYNSYALTDHDDDALGRRARVYHYLGEIQDKLGNLPEADGYFQGAYEATEKLLTREPNNADRIFEHAQSAFWVGYRQYNRENFDIAKEYFQFYLDMAERLGEVEGETERAQQELAYAYTNMGALELDYGNPNNAVAFLNQSLSLQESIFEKSSKSRSDVISLFTGYRDLSNLEIRLNNFEESVRLIKKANSLLQSDEIDAEFELLKLNNLRSLLHLYYLSGDEKRFSDELQVAKSHIERLNAIESENLDSLFVISLVNIIEYEFLFTSGKTSDLDDLKSRIEADYARLAKADNRQSKAIKFLLHNLSVYHALIKSESPTEPINGLKEALSLQGITSSAQVKEAPYVLPSVLLLQNLEINEAYTKIINQICDDKQFNLNYVNRVFLGTAPANDNCPLAVTLNQQNSISKAAELFAALIREEKNDK